MKEVNGLIRAFITFNGLAASGSGAMRVAISNTSIASAVPEPAAGRSGDGDGRSLTRPISPPEKKFLRLSWCGGSKLTGIFDHVTLDCGLFTCFQRTTTRNRWGREFSQEGSARTESE